MRVQNVNIYSNCQIKPFKGKPKRIDYSNLSDNEKKELINKINTLEFLGKGATAEVFSTPDGKYVIKAFYNTKKTREILADLEKEKKLIDELENRQTFEGKDISVAKQNWVYQDDRTKRIYVCYDRVKGEHFTLEDLIADDAKMDAFMKAIKELKKSGIYHGDFHKENIFFVKK